jgi:hypothetical protein
MLSLVSAYVLKGRVNKVKLMKLNTTMKETISGARKLPLHHHQQ